MSQKYMNDLIFSNIFSGECAKVSDWLDEEAGVLTPVEEFQSKLKILKEMAAPVMARLREHRERPEALDVLRWLGVAFLGLLAGQAFYRVLRGRASLEAGEARRSTVKGVILTTLAVTLLNPQVYLDTLLLIPAVGAQQQDPATFVAGASSASVLWFGALAWAGSRLAPWLARPAAWRVIDGVIGLMMAAIAIQLAAGGL